MTERDKQIEEMARAIYESRVAIDGIDIAFAAVHGAEMEDSHFMRIAGHLYRNGYRKVSDVAAEIFAEIEDFMIDSTIYKMPAKSMLSSKFAELKKKYTEDGE